MFDTSHTFTDKHPVPNPHSSGFSSPNKKYILFPREEKAIKQYTGVSNEGLKSDKINVLLRNNSSGGEEFDKQIRFMDSGIKKVAKNNAGLRKTFRGIGANLPDLQEGKTYTDLGYMSTSHGDTIESRKTIRRCSGQGTTSIVIGKNGADISETDLSPFPNEREVLYPRKSKFDVVFKAMISPECRAALEDRKNTVVSSTAQYVAVLAQKGMPERDLSDIRKSQHFVDLSPSMPPVSEERLRQAAIRNDYTPNTYHIDTGPIESPVSQERIDSADIV